MTSFNTLIVLPSGEEVEVCVEFDYTPIIPAKTSCLPEDSTPAEGGEVWIDKLILVETGESLDQTNLSFKELEWIEKKAKENIEKAEEELEDEQADYLYECGRDS
jgi:hypothetical protein